MNEEKLGRELILKKLEETLESVDYVYAMWQCGSAAFKRVDEWSDIDVVIDVEDEKTIEVFSIIDKALESLSPIESSFGCAQPMSIGAYQKVYKLHGTSKFLVIEICAVRHSSTDKFLQREIHGDVFVHFDKKNVTEYKSIDKNEFDKKIKTLIEQIYTKFNLYQFLVDKELNRNNYIEAIAFYNNFSLGPLVDILRIKYKPYRYGFRTRYVYYDLPANIVKRLENLYFIKDNNDLKIKHEEVIKWFNETAEELRKINM